MTRDEWLALAAKCEEAKGPDREIDRAITCGAIPMFAECLPYWDEGTRELCVPRLTASLDAITALIERELPGWIWTVYSKAIGPHPMPRATVVGTDYRTQIGCNAASPALALCAAFCRAMSVKAPQASQPPDQ